MVEMPVRFNRFADEDDFFAQFASDDEEREDEPEPETDEIDGLMQQFNVDKPKPTATQLWFDEIEQEQEQEQEPIKKTNNRKNDKTIFFSDEEDEEDDSEPEDDYTKENTTEPTKPNETEQRRDVNKPKQLFFGFDSEDEEETGGGPKTKIANIPPDREVKDIVDPDTLLNAGIEEPDEYDESQLIPDGMPLKPVNPFLKKLRRRDPVLFMTKPTGKYKAFSVSCQPTSRHPVILTQDELDKTDKSAYKHALKYGSDPNNPNYFICPRFWCFLTNSAISEEDIHSASES
jgi:hypothetical protein